ncbi:MAG: cytochrome c nitrite reductase small subunit [Gemmataceae bacterium]
MKLLAFGMAGFPVAIFLGMFLGAGSYTFYYGEGASYFSKEPTSCINCHIMQPHYDTWLKSSHHAVATCADCHMPRAFPHDLIAKADNGWNHSWAFTFQDFHEPIQIKPRNQRILENNCLACHETLVHQMVGHHAHLDPKEGVSCLHCHADVGHTYPPR